MLVLEGPLPSVTIQRRERGSSHSPKPRENEGRATFALSAAFRSKDRDLPPVSAGCELNLPPPKEAALSGEAWAQFQLAGLPRPRRFPLTPG